MYYFGSLTKKLKTPENILISREIPELKNPGKSRKNGIPRGNPNHNIILKSISNKVQGLVQRYLPFLQLKPKRLGKNKKIFLKHI